MGGQVIYGYIHKVGGYYILSGRKEAKGSHRLTNKAAQGYHRLW